MTISQLPFWVLLTVWYPCNFLHLSLDKLDREKFQPCICFLFCYSPSHAFPFKIRCRCVLHRTSLYIYSLQLFCSSIAFETWNAYMNMRLRNILMRQLKLYFRKLNVFGTILTFMVLLIFSESVSRCWREMILFSRPWLSFFWCSTDLASIFSFLNCLRAIKRRTWHWTIMIWRCERR